MNASLHQVVNELKLKWILENLDDELAETARKNRTTEQLLQRLLTGELEARKARAAEARLKKARIPVVKTLDKFLFTWPKQINKDLVRHLFTLRFMDSATNVVFLGPTGVGKTHLASALAYHVCQQGLNVIFTTAVAMLQSLQAAHINGTLKRELHRYTSTSLLTIDELGYLPVDRQGADLLFQVISARYEQNSTIITTNRAFQDWAPCFNDDATVTSVVLDRVCHHCEVVMIKGSSYRMKHKLETTETTAES